jgi:hypothetical protein
LDRAYDLNGTGMQRFCKRISCPPRSGSGQPVVHGRLRGRRWHCLQKIDAAFTGSSDERGDGIVATARAAPYPE